MSQNMNIATCKITLLHTKLDCQLPKKKQTKKNKSATRHALPVWLPYKLTCTKATLLNMTRLKVVFTSFNILPVILKEG